MAPEQVLEVIQMGKDIICLLGVMCGVVISCCFWLLMKGVRK